MPEPAEIALQPQVRHHGGDDAGLGEPAVGLPAFGDHRHELVAVDHVAALVDDDQPVGVAVERDADVGADLAHLGRERRGLGRAAFLVDVEAVRLDADLDDLGAQFPQRFRRDLVGGAVGAIDHHAQAFERKIARQRALGEFDVAVLHAVDALGAAEIGGVRELLAEIAVDQFLDLQLDLVGQLVAVRAEQLDAVVVVRIVRGGDHHAEIGAHRARQHRHRRRRHRAGEQHVHADRGEARDQRGLDHVAGQPRVLADQHAMPVVAVLKNQARGLTDLERKLRRDRAVGAAANAVGAEIFANHAVRPQLHTSAGGPANNRRTLAPNGLPNFICLPQAPWAAM